jgi:hypothetical protein
VQFWLIFWDSFNDPLISNKISDCAEISVATVKIHDSILDSILTSENLIPDDTIIER